MKCPYCGGNPVVYDTGLHAYVCSHCGAVIEEHPVEYKLGRGEHPNVSRDDVRRIKPLYKMGDGLVRVVEDQCSRLGLSKYLCLQAKKRFESAVANIVRKRHLQKVYPRRLEYVSLACIYATLIEHGSTISIRRLSRVLGLENGKLFTVLYRYRDEIGFKHVDKRMVFINRVMSALRNQLSDSEVDEVRREVVRMAVEVPYASTNPLFYATMLAIIASKRLGLRVEVKKLAEDLGFSRSQIKSIYTRIKVLEKRVEEVDKLKKLV